MRTYSEIQTKISEHKISRYELGEFFEQEKSYVMQQLKDNKDNKNKRNVSTYRLIKQKTIRLFDLVQSSPFRDCERQLINSGYYHALDLIDKKIITALDLFNSSKFELPCQKTTLNF